jgi:hypothetical protein
MTITVSDAKSLRIKTGCGWLRLLFILDEKGNPENCTIKYGKGGVCGASQIEGISRMIKLCLKGNIEMSFISKQLRGIRCNMPTREDVLSCSDGIGKLIDRFIENKEKYHIADAGKMITDKEDK